MQIIGRHSNALPLRAERWDQPGTTFLKKSVHE
jgi:hypothetical protein